MNLAKYFIALALLALLTACGGGGGNPGTSSAGAAALPLFTSAPTSISLASGSTSPSYSISGGVAPYTVTSDKPSVISAPLNGALYSVSIAAGSSGSGSISITDAKGAKVQVAVTILSPSATPVTALFVDAPANLTIAAGALGNTYTVSGGAGSYTAVSSDETVATSTKPDANGRFVIQGKGAGNASVTVKDALGTAIAISVTVPAPAAFFSTAPGTLQILSGATNFYTVFGGTAPYVVNSNSGIITDVVLTGASLSIRGKVPGHQTVAISDAKGAVINIDVTVNQGLYTDAPSNLSIVNGTGITYSIFGGIPYGGATAYRVNSSNPAVASAAISGTTLSISGLSSGATSLVISDSVGATTTVAVTVPVAGALVSTAPSSLSLATGASGAYVLSGGSGTYTVTSANPSIVGAAVTGSTLTISAVADTAGGAANVTVTDSVHTSPLTIAVTAVPVQFFTTAPPALFLTPTGQATYTIFGGVPPFSVQSGNLSAVSGTVSGRSFTLQAVAAGTAQVLVKDSNGLSVPVSVTVGSANQFFVAAPGATNMGIGTASPAYQISGGAKPYSVTSSDGRVATATVDPASSTLTISAVAVGTTTLRITDAIGASYSITVVVDNPSGTASAVPTSIDILASSNTLNSTPNSSISFIVTVKDRLNATLPLQTVAFSASSGTLSGVSPSPVTGAAGTIATVTLAPGADASNRNITVTAATGSVSKSITIPVVGTTLTVSGPGAALVGAGVQSFTVKAVDSSGKPIVGAALTITSALGNGLSPQTVTTDSSGAATVGFTATNVGTDTLTVAGLGTSGTATVVVSNVDFAFTTPAAAALLPVGAANPVTVRYRVGGVGVAGQTVTFSSTRGSLSATTAVTDASGDATVNVSSTTAGSVTVSAQLGSARTSLTASFVATVPAVLVLQANPAAVLPNASGSSTNQSALTAVVRDATGNPVQNVVVNFSAISDASNGSISPGSATTDTSGTATVQFIAGSSSTAANGVQIQAVVQSSPTITGTSTLTVNGAALFISIGRSSGLTSVDASTYQKDFSVYVTDANGAPAANRAVTLSVWPLTYGKGTLSYSVPLTRWTYTGGAPASVCANEDANKNGTLDLLPLPSEDINGDGILQPGIPAVITPSVTTDAQGFGTFTLRYGKNYAWWVSTQITAKSLVSGTESKQLQTYDLEMLSTDATSASTPPNAVSPFGTAALCTTAG